MMPEQDHNIRFVAPEDKSFWLSIDKHLSEAEFDKKVRDKQGYVALSYPPKLQKRRIFLKYWVEKSDTLMKSGHIGIERRDDTYASRR